MAELHTHDNAGKKKRLTTPLLVLPCQAFASAFIAIYDSQNADNVGVTQLREQRDLEKAG
jgi:hypothetical protein